MTIAISGLVGGVMKLCQQGFGMWHAAVEGARVMSVERAGNTVYQSIFGIGTDLSPALISVGYIVGRNIGILVVAGGLISWVVAIPIYTAIYGFEGEPMDAAWTIWNSQIRYLGVGAMVVGGIWSLIKLFKPLMSGIKASLAAIRKSGQDQDRPLQERDFPINYVGIALGLLLIPVFLLYFDIVDHAALAVLLALVMMIFGFLFSAVAAYMAGVVGSSNK